jgi:Ran GTPase-activating protein 1
MASTSTILQLQGRGLKLNGRSDIDPLLKGVDPALIEEIHLGGNTIGVAASEALAEFLQKATSLKVSKVLAPNMSVQTRTIYRKTQVANFADIFTGRLITEIPLSLAALCNALIDKTSLVEINLSDNAFGGRSVDPMIPFLRHNRSFQILKLNNNGLGPAGGSAIANALIESANLSKKEGKHSNLRVVVCGRNRLEDGSAPVWAEAFAAHGTLEVVRMPQNGIRMSGITALAKGLSHCKGLLSVDLQDNTFIEGGDLKGVEEWAHVLPSWPDLHTLNLSDCVLSEEGEVPHILKALTTGSNPKLLTLELQNNNLEAKTFALLADAISTHLGQLMTLALQWNEVDDDDESLENIRDTLKARGGKLFVSDEEEEEEEEEEGGEGEEKQEKERREEKENAGKEEKPRKGPTTDVDKETDDLADLLSKATI